MKKSKTIKTTVWDAAEYLETDEDIEEYLKAVFETGDTQLMITAIGDVARAKGMTKIASQMNCGRESLYKSLSKPANKSQALK